MTPETVAHKTRAARLQEAHAVLERAATTFRPDRIALVSAFGPGSIVLAHLLHTIDVRLPVIFIDTLHHFPETLELVDRARDRFGFELRVFRAAPSRDAFDALHGPRLWEWDLDRYHQLTKVEPFRRGVAGLDAYITGRRRDQASTRAGLGPWEPGTPVRINPLASWSRADVWAWIGRHDLPYNPLHDRGYASIGDAPLTTPVRAGEHERAGRWRGLDRAECGIHTVVEYPTPDPEPGGEHVGSEDRERRHAHRGARLHESGSTRVDGMGGAASQ